MKEKIKERKSREEAAERLGNEIDEAEGYLDLTLVFVCCYLTRPGRLHLLQSLYAH